MAQTLSKIFDEEDLDEKKITFLLSVAFDFSITGLQIEAALQISRLSIFKSYFWPLATFGELKSPPATKP